MPPIVFKSSPHIPTAINVHHSLIDTFLSATSRNDSEITISINSEQNIPISKCRTNTSIHGDSVVYTTVPHSNKLSVNDSSSFMGLKSSIASL